MDQNLAEKILRHGTHTSSCRWRGGHDCDCGWEELKKEAEAFLHPKQETPPPKWYPYNGWSDDPDSDYDA